MAKDNIVSILIKETKRGNIEWYDHCSYYGWSYSARYKENKFEFRDRKLTIYEKLKYEGLRQLVETKLEIISALRLKFSINSSLNKKKRIKQKESKKETDEVVSNVARKLLDTPPSDS